MTEGFQFQERIMGMINWKDIDRLSIRDVIDRTDVHVLEKLIQPITFGHISPSHHVHSRDLVKFIHLSQLCLEHLLHLRQADVQTMKDLENDLDEADSTIHGLKHAQKKFKSQLKHLTSMMLRQQQTLATCSQMLCLHGATPGAMAAVQAAIAVTFQEGKRYPGRTNIKQRTDISPQENKKQGEVWTTKHQEMTQEMTQEMNLQIAQQSDHLRQMSSEFKHEHQQIKKTLQHELNGLAQQIRNQQQQQQQQAEQTTKENDLQLEIQELRVTLDEKNKRIQGLQMDLDEKNTILQKRLNEQEQTKHVPAIEYATNATQTFQALNCSIGIQTKNIEENQRQNTEVLASQSTAAENSVVSQDQMIQCDLLVSKLTFEEEEDEGNWHNGLENSDQMIQCDLLVSKLTFEKEEDEGNWHNGLEHSDQMIQCDLLVSKLTFEEEEQEQEEGDSRLTHSDQMIQCDLLVSKLTFEEEEKTLGQLAHEKDSEQHQVFYALTSKWNEEQVQEEIEKYFDTLDANMAVGAARVGDASRQEEEESRSMNGLHTPFQCREYIKSKWNHSEDQAKERVSEIRNILSDLAYQKYGLALSTLGIDNTQSSYFRHLISNHLELLPECTLAKMLTVDQQVSKISQEQYCAIEQQRQVSIHRLKETMFISTKRHKQLAQSALSPLS